MQIIKNLQTFMLIINDLHKDKSKSIGFVPTMGALHYGHISLMQKAKQDNTILIVSIFLNPKQFDANEDLSTYPQNQQKDIEACQRAKCDILFVPSYDDIYPNDDEIKLQSPKIGGYVLEGASRANHFNGMLLVVMKFFNIIKPHFAYFGKKDAQQLLLIKQMVKDFFLDVKIIECETIRDKDGLAFSSRNIYLKGNDRSEALGLIKALSSCGIEIQKGQTKCKILKNKMQDILKDSNVSYAEIVNKKLQQIEHIEIKNTIILVAIIINNKRYIDNVWL